MMSCSTPGHAADDRVAAYADELMHAGEAAENGPVVHRHVAAQGRIVGHDDMVAHDAVMSDVGRDHEQAVVADARQHAAVRRPRTHGHVLADDVVGADLETRRLAPVLGVLGRMTDRGEGIDARTRPDACASCNDGVRDQTNLVAEHDVGSHHAVGADADALAELGAGLDDRGRVNIRHVSCRPGSSPSMSLPRPSGRPLQLWPRTSTRSGGGASWSHGRKADRPAPRAVGSGNRRST